MNYDKIMDKVGGYIIQGLSEHESALLSGITWQKLEELKSRSNALKDFLEKKKIEFKQKHLETISKKADPKTAQWLLEKLCPEQFATKKVADTPTNVFAVLIKEIQNDDQKIVKRIEATGGKINKGELSIEKLLN